MGASAGWFELPTACPSCRRDLHGALPLALCSDLPHAAHEADPGQLARAPFDPTRGPWLERIPPSFPVQLLHPQLQRARALGQRSHLRSSGFTPGGGAPSAKLVWAAMTIPRLPCPSTSTCLDIVTGPASGTSPTVRRTGRVFTPSLTCRQGSRRVVRWGKGASPATPVQRTVPRQPGAALRAPGTW